MKLFSQNVMNVFANANCTYEDYKNLMADYVCGNEILDAEGNKVSRRDAHEKIVSMMFALLGIEKGKATKRDIRRALERNGRDLFDVLEEVIDIEVAKGFRESEFFNAFVETKNIAQGDRFEFWTSDDTLLAVSKVSGNHHDISLQRLGEGSVVPVPTSVYAIAVGADIDRVLLGQEDFTRLVDACAKAFVKKIQEDIYAEVMTANNVPAALKGTGNLTTDVMKTQFDQILEDVSTANNNAPVYILGTRVALSKLIRLVDVNWTAESQKQSVADTGRLGSYNGYGLIEIAQRFANDVDFNGTQANLSRLVDNNLLLIMPQTEDKFVKFIDVGETEIYEVTEKGKGSGRIDDIREYAVQREMGVATLLGRYHGAWTLA